MFGADEKCCQEGVDYAVLYDDDKDPDEVVVPSVVCYARALSLASLKKFPNKCLLAYFKSCENMLQDLTGKLADSLAVAAVST